MSPRPEPPHQFVDSVVTMADLHGSTPPTHRLADVVDTALDRSVVGGFTAFGYAVRRHLPTWPADPATGALAGRRIIVTGSSSGLGQRCAADLLALGADVLMVVRDVEKGERAADAVRRDVRGVTGAGDPEVWHCDVSDLDSVRTFATSLLATGKPIHGIVHNAGSLPQTRTESAQGHELTMALHVLGPILMTELLLPALSGHGSRVVFVASGGMYTQPLPSRDPEFLHGDYEGAVAYARSKRGQVELLPELAARWGAHGIAVDAMHPGWAATPGLTSSLPRFERVLRPALRSDTVGADTTVWLLAAEPSPPSGLFWHDRKPRPTSYLSKTKPTVAERKVFWDWVVACVGLD